MSDLSTDTTAPKTSRQRGGKHNTPEETLAEFRNKLSNTSAVEVREQAKQYIIGKTEFEDTTVREFALWLLDKALWREIKDPPPDLTVIEKQKVMRRAAKQRLVNTFAAKVEEKIEAEVNIRLMEYQTMYGKALGDCTGAECERLSRRYGGFYAELSKRLTRSETVRAHMSEAELQSIARTYRMIGEKATR